MTTSTKNAVAKTAEKNVTDFKVFSPENLTADDVRKYICDKATDNEIAYFLQVCKINKLNPFKKEVYLVKYEGYPASILTAYEVYLKRAERSNKYAGLKSWIEGEGTEMKGCVEIRRKDWDIPLYHEIDFKEYCQYKKTRDGGKEPTTFWREKPKTMLKKVVVSQGLRLAFPDEVGSLPYAKEEIDGGEVIDVHPTGKPEVQETVAIESEQQEPAADGKIKKDDWIRLVASVKDRWTESQIADHAKKQYKIGGPKELSRWDFDMLLEHVTKTNPDGTAAK